MIPSASSTSLHPSITTASLKSTEDCARQSLYISIPGCHQSWTMKRRGKNMRRTSLFSRHFMLTNVACWTDLLLGCLHLRLARRRSKGRQIGVYVGSLNDAYGGKRWKTATLSSLCRRWNSKILRDYAVDMDGIHSCPGEYQKVPAAMFSSCIVRKASQNNRVDRRHDNSSSKACLYALVTKVIEQLWYLCGG